jgi:hypothetical protein
MRQHAESKSQLQRPSLTKSQSHMGWAHARTRAHTHTHTRSHAHYTPALLSQSSVKQSILYRRDSLNQAWGCTPIIPAFGRPRQKGHEFKASLGYVESPCLKTTTNQGQLRLSTIGAPTVCGGSHCLCLRRLGEVTNSDSHSPLGEFQDPGGYEIKKEKRKKQGTPG